MFGYLERGGAIDIAGLMYEPFYPLLIVPKAHVTGFCERWRGLKFEIAAGLHFPSFCHQKAHSDHIFVAG